MLSQVFTWMWSLRCSNFVHFSWLPHNLVGILSEPWYVLLCEVASLEILNRVVASECFVRSLTLSFFCRSQGTEVTYRISLEKEFGVQFRILQMINLFIDVSFYWDCLLFHALYVVCAQCPCKIGSATRSVLSISLQRNKKNLNYQFEERKSWKGRPNLIGTLWLLSKLQPRSTSTLRTASELQSKSCCLNKQVALSFCRSTSVSDSQLQKIQQCHHLCLAQNVLL